MADRNHIPASALRGALRLTELLAVTLIFLPFCTLALAVAAIFGRRARERAVMALTPWFCHAMAAGMGMRIRVIGTRDDRVRVFVGNHVTYLDILVAGAAVGGVFVSRHDVKDWPVIGLFARLAGTIFLDRRSLRSAVISAEEVTARIGRDVRIALFPEGGTTGGLGVGPFKPFLFGSVAGTGVLVQPFTINYESIGKYALTKERRELIYWYDPAPSFSSHGWRLLTLPPVTVSLTFGEPIAAPDASEKEVLREFGEELRRRVAERLLPLPSERP